jgi:AraC-like DNA-binding protein
MTILPATVTPKALADQLGWSEKRVRRLAKRLGACRILGNRMILLPQDIETLMEATKCPSSSTAAKPSGTIAEPLMAVSYEDRLAQRTAKSRRNLQPRSKPETGNVVSMDLKRR